MGCGHGVGGVLMEDLIYPHLWSDKKESKNSDNDEDSDHDLRKLFPKEKSTKKKSVSKISKKGTPEWLAVSVGVFFVGALFTIASYQVYRGSYKRQLSHIKIYDDDESATVFADEPQEDVYNKMKLPPDIVPISHILYLRINIKKKTYSGLVSIEVLCKHNTSRLIVHTAYHHIKKMRLRTEDNSSWIHINKVSRNREKEMLILSLNQTLIEGHKYSLYFSFSADLDYTFQNGIYLSKYKDGNGKTREMVSTDLEPTRARRLCPCFDEPAMKATWKLIIVPEDDGFNATSNMPIEKIRILDSGKQEIFFDVTPVMSSYLVVLAVSEYEYKDTVSPEKNIKVGIFAPIGRLNEATKALEYATFAVDYFSKEFGIDYMLPKLDMFPVSKFSAGADETWGNIVFSENALLLNPQTSSDSHRKRVAECVSHEISHMWFGDLVTMKWWNDLWLKESFARYLQTLPVGKMNPLWDVKTSLYNNKRSALSFDFSQYTHPIMNMKSNNNTNSLFNSYDAITYNKGASIVNMLAHYIGHDKLFNGLKLYLGKLKYSNANMTQLWQALSEKAAPVDVVEFMNAWVTQPGFPVVNIEANGNKLKVSQEKYKYKGLHSAAKRDVDELLWHLPLNIMICDTKTTIKRLLTTKQDEFSVEFNCKSKLYKANVGATGYYHVNYDKDNWNRLLHVMNTNHTMLPPIDRANILYDAYSLASSNNGVNITVPLAFSHYLWKEDFPEAWTNGMAIMNKIRHVFFDTPLKKCVEEYIGKRMIPVLDKLNSVKNHIHSQINLIRNLLSYAVAFDMEPFSGIMMNLFLKWAVSEGEEKLPVNTRGIILCAGIRNGDVYGFNYVKKAAHNAKSISDQHLFKSALACSKDKVLLQGLVDEAVNKTDIRLLQYVCSNHKGRDAGWKAVKENFDAFFAKYNADTGSIKHLLMECIGGTTHEHLKDAEKFIESKDLGRFKVDGLRAIDRIRHNIDFAKRHKDHVTSWFKKHDSKCLT